MSTTNNNSSTALITITILVFGFIIFLAVSKTPNNSQTLSPNNTQKFVNENEEKPDQTQIKHKAKCDFLREAEGQNDIKIDEFCDNHNDADKDATLKCKIYLTAQRDGKSGKYLSIVKKYRGKYKGCRFTTVQILQKIQSTGFLQPYNEFRAYVGQKEIVLRSHSDYGRQGHYNICVSHIGSLKIERLFTGLTPTLSHYKEINKEYTWADELYDASAGRDTRDVAWKNLKHKYCR